MKIKPTVIDTTILSLAYGFDFFYSFIWFHHRVSDVSLSLPYMSFKNILQITILRLYGSGVFIFVSLFLFWKTLVLFNAKTRWLYFETVFTLKNWLVQFSCRILCTTHGDTFSFIRNVACVKCCFISLLSIQNWKKTPANIVDIQDKMTPCFPFSCRVRY